MTFTIYFMKYSQKTLVGLVAALGFLFQVSPHSSWAESLADGNSASLPVFEGQVEDVGRSGTRTVGQSKDPGARTRESYFDYKPSIGVEFKGTSPGVREVQLLDSAGVRSSVHSMLLSVEYQPRFIQRYGVLGLGAELGIHPPSAPQGQVPGITFAWSAGGRTRYQARFFQEQALVPYAGYQLSLWMHRLRSGTSDALLAHGPLVGIEFLLNALDSKSAARFFEDYGVSRTYILVEGNWMNGKSTSASLESRSFFFGLRFEM